MKKYAFIYHVSQKIESEDFHEQHMNWFKELGDKVVDSGNPFNPESEAKVAEGSVVNDVDTAAGYSIISANDLSEAVELAKGCPMAKLPGCWIKVYETMSM